MGSDFARDAFSPEEVAEARRYALVIEWSDENAAYLAIAPDLPGVVTDGRTPAEAAAMGQAAVIVWLRNLSGESKLIAMPWDFKSMPRTQCVLTNEANGTGSARIGKGILITSRLSPFKTPLPASRTPVDGFT